MNILVIDNYDSLRELCTVILSDAGHSVISSNFTNYNRFFTPDIDLVTINMSPIYPEPTNEAYELFRAINPNIKVLLISVNWGCETFDKLVNKGCHSLYTPFEVGALTNTVEMICKNTPKENVLTL